MTENETTPALSPAQWTVNLWQGEDILRIREAEDAVANAMPTNSLGMPLRLGDTSSVTEAVARRDELQREAKPRAIQVTVERLPRKLFRDLVKKHPPRDGDEGDKEYGFNQEDLAEELLAYDKEGKRTIVAPAFKSSASRQEFLDDLSDAQFTLLFEAAYEVNRGGVPDPKADMSLRVTQIYGETSKLPERLGD
mgnify:CR=1 FL=1